MFGMKNQNGGSTTLIIIINHHCEKKLKIRLLVSTQYMNVTQTPYDGNGRASCGKK